jgi:hypothetical protein
MISQIIPQNKNEYVFDSERTKTLVNLFAEQPGICKILLSPEKNPAEALSKKGRVSQITSCST